MPILPQVQIANIYGGSFTDVQGNAYSYQTGGDISIHQVDPLFQALSPVTATGAAYNSQERHPPPKCYPGTRPSILKDLEEWVMSGATGHRGSVTWLHGPAGAGKSAVAQTLCESSADRGHLASSFFFSRGNAHRGSINRVFPTIAFHLALSAPDLRDRITQVVHDNPLIGHEAMTPDQVERLIVKPIQSRVSKVTTSTPPFLIVIDGVDECTGNNNQGLLLTNLVDLIRAHHLPLYILVVSRPEPHILHFFKDVNIHELKVVSLLGDHQAHVDIFSFLRAGFDKIHDAECHSDIMRHVEKPWPQDRIVNDLVTKSGGYFIYASVVLRFVEEEYFSPLGRLDNVLHPSLSSPTTAFAELDKLYIQILSISPKPVILKRILACVLLPVNTLSSGVTASMIELLLDLRRGEVMLALRGLHSLLSFEQTKPGKVSLGAIVVEAGEIQIRSLHASLADFVFSEDRSGVFFIDTHADVALASWKRVTTWSNTTSQAIRRSAKLYLLDSLYFHFHSIQDKAQFLAKKTAVNALTDINPNTWAPFIHASNTWDIVDKHRLLCAIEKLLLGLQVLVPSPEAIIRQMTALTDFIFSVHLSLQSPGNIQFIQRVLIIFGNMWPDETHKLWLLKARNVAALNVLQPESMQHSSWQDIYFYLNTWNPYDAKQTNKHDHGRLCTRRIFVDFMNDPRRCGDLFADARIRHARLAFSCGQYLLAGEPRTATWTNDQ
ncbi:hypothetical protein FPV67DRAFT_1722400 [Lyophyllum atratum]|nr:hypothetical protein FPV67DRAFT_1722400 [Lyophyllum atratum]